MSFLSDVELMEVCPGCGGKLSSAACHFYYSTWLCFDCGGTIDGRTGGPKLVKKCMNDWPDYRRRGYEPVHPLVCSCTGRGWYEIGGDHEH